MANNANKYAPFDDVGGPILITWITKDFDENTIHIANITPLFEGKSLPSPEQARFIRFDFTNLDLERAKVNERNEELGLSSLEAVLNSIEMLWANTLEAIEICNLPGLKLSDFVDELPETGGAVQWTRGDLNKIIQATQGIFSSVRQ